jgi:hypothetical protein
VIVLADNDIVIKLAQCDLFDEFLAAFRIDHSGVFILRRSRFSLLTSSKQRRMGDESYRRMELFLGSIADISETPDPNLIAALTEQTDKNIDAGEAVLFAVGPQIAQAVIATGDKRSLKGLHCAATEDEVCRGLCEALTGRVICFEQVLKAILGHFTFEEIRERLIAGRECDGGLKLWLGSTLDATESNFSAGLSSHLDELRATTGSLLIL